MSNRGGLMRSGGLSRQALLVHMVRAHPQGAVAHHRQKGLQRHQKLRSKQVSVSQNAVVRGSVHIAAGLHRGAQYLN